MNLNTYFILIVILSLKLPIITVGQTIQKEEMQKLSHFVGDWVGTSTAFKDGEIVRQIPAYEKISFKVDEHILTIDLHSEALKLHTVVHYDEGDKTYYYNPYYQQGTAKYPAQLVDGKLVVSPSETKRFIFEITEEGKFREYGETFENGKWIMYFEDVFSRN
jgi:hypothetical protein